MCGRPEWRRPGKPRRPSRDAGPSAGSKGESSRGGRRVHQVAARSVPARTAERRFQTPPARSGIGTPLAFECLDQQELRAAAAGSGRPDGRPRRRVDRRRPGRGSSSRHRRGGEHPLTVLVVESATRSTSRWAAFPPGPEVHRADRQCPRGATQPAVSCRRTGSASRDRSYDPARRRTRPRRPRRDRALPAAGAAPDATAGVADF